MRLPQTPETLAEYCAQNATAVTVGDRILCRILGRKPFFVPASDLSISPHLAVSGFWEPNVTTFLVDLVEPGWTWGDIGANFGYYSVLLSELTHGAPGMACEPNPVSFACLRDNLAINGCWSAKADAVAIGDHESTARITWQPNCLGGCSTISTRYRDLYPRQPVETLEVPVRRWTQQHVDILKIDAEGCDLDIVLSLSDPPAHLLFEHAPLFGDRSEALRRIAERWTLQRIDDSGTAVPISVDDLVRREAVEMLYATWRGDG